MRIRFGKEEDIWQDALCVRRLVFIEEQQVSEDLEIDGFEKECIHFVLYKDKPIGAGRLRVIDDYVKAERVCILTSYRSEGFGRLIMEEMESVAKTNGFKKIKLNSQQHAEAFYIKLGYETISDIFFEANIPHVQMVKELN